MQTALLIRQYLLQFCYGICSSRNNSAATMSVSDFVSIGCVSCLNGVY